MATIDSKVPSEDEIKEDLVAAGDPKVDETLAEAMKYIEHFHGKEEVEAYRQKLLEEKAAEIRAQLEAQEAAELKAKAEAQERAAKEAAELEAKVNGPAIIDE